MFPAKLSGISDLRVQRLAAAACAASLSPAGRRRERVPYPGLRTVGSFREVQSPLEIVRLDRAEKDLDQPRQPTALVR
jgi:hypothetical protein